MERLQKVIAQTNIASRRQAEKLILEGRVKVNGEVVKTLGTKVSRSDVILVDNKKIVEARKTYLLLNKPTGYLSTTVDDKKRRTVMDLLLDEYKDKRLYPIGRLDYDEAGVLLLTNDGDLTLLLTNPQVQAPEEFFVRVKGIIIRKDIIKIRNGITLDKDNKFKPKEVNLVELDKANQSTLIRIVLNDGKNNMIKKALETLGYPVKTITRLKYDFLDLEGVKRGGYRELTIHEVKKLYSSQHKIS